MPINFKMVVGNWTKHPPFSHHTHLARLAVTSANRVTGCWSTRHPASLNYDASRVRLAIRQWLDSQRIAHAAPTYAVGVSSGAMLFSITYLFCSLSSRACQLHRPTTDSALDVFKHRLASGHISVLVFYRGERSFFCRQWLRRWLTIPALERRLELADVVVLFTSSQSQGKAFSVTDQIAGHHSLLDRRLLFFGDPEHLLINCLIERGISKPVITNPDSHRAHGWVFDYGMVQPAIVAITSDSAIVYDWTSKPTILSVAGKLDRPDPWDIWDCI